MYEITYSFFLHVDNFCTVFVVLHQKGLATNGSDLLAISGDIFREINHHVRLNFCFQKKYCPSACIKFAYHRVAHGAGLVGNDFARIN
jgi:hypothetical protein